GGGQSETLEGSYLTFTPNPQRCIRFQGALDAPILSQGTHQARPGSRKRPDPHGDSNRRAGTVTTQRVWRVMTRRELTTLRAGRGLPQRIPPLPQRAMAETTLNKKNAFDDEVALTVAPFYLIHMLQRTFPARFITPCLPTRTDKLPSKRV